MYGRRYQRPDTNLLMTEYPSSRYQGYSGDRLSGQRQSCERFKPEACVKRQYFVVYVWSIYYRAFDQLGPATCTSFTPVETCSPPSQLVPLLYSCLLEKILYEPAALVFPDAAGDPDAMVELPVARHVHHGPAGAGFRV